jgi:hypothetical protein
MKVAHHQNKKNIELWGAPTIWITNKPLRTKLELNYWSHLDLKILKFWKCIELSFEWKLTKWLSNLIWQVQTNVTHVLNQNPKLGRFLAQSFWKEPMNIN